jgi:Uncharacterized protein conserved in bacteria
LPLNNLTIKQSELFYDDKIVTRITEEKQLHELISSNNNFACRIRKQNNNYIFTIKFREAPGIRKEWEWIVGDNFEEYFTLKLPRISKMRYKLQYEGNIWEIDEFLENNSNLIIAEVELESLDVELALPKWLDKEITGEIKYLNSELAKLKIKQ